MKPPAMKTPTHKSKPVVDVSKLLAEALKQPGIATVVEVYEMAEKFDRPVSEFNAIVEWQRYPAVVSSCDSTHPT